MLLLALPAVQGFLHLFKEEPLHGGIVENPKPTFTLENWLNGTFQEVTNNYLNDHTGFRSFLVRLHNQWDYWLFDKVHANSVIRGKDNYLYEYNYIKAFYGLDYIGEDSIRHNLERLAKIRENLNKKGKELIFVFAASKAQFYPEYFPDSIHYKKNITNYETYLRLVNELQIPHIDFNKFFLEAKDSSKYPLYPQYGIHWTHYGACLVADSLIHYIEHKLNKDLPEPEWHKVHLAPPSRDDNDIERGLNLLAPLPSKWYAYPQLKYDKDENLYLPNTMVIADSYYWSLFNLGISKSFNRNPFWYYMSEIYEAGGVPKKSFSLELLQKDLEECELIMIMSTDANLTNVGWGFFENALAITDGIQFRIPRYHEKINNLIQYIPTDSAWMHHIRKKAQDQKLSVDSVIRMDAKWMVEQDFLKENK